MRAAAKAKLPFTEIVRLSPPLFCSTTVPLRPEIVPPTVKVMVAQLTVTLLTLAPATVPVPFATLQLWPAALALHDAPPILPWATGAEKVKLPSAETVRSLPPLFRSTTVPLRPEIVPPTVKILSAQVTVTLIKFAPATVPAPLATVQVWPAGCARTATA